MGPQEKECSTKIKNQNDKLENYKHMKDTLKIEKSPEKKIISQPLGSLQYTHTLRL